jgi:hypothetical protein
MGDRGLGLGRYDAGRGRRGAHGLANLLDLYIPIVNTTCVYDGASFPPIPIAEIEAERELVLDFNIWERIQLHRKGASNDYKQRSRIIDRQARLWHSRQLVEKSSIELANLRPKSSSGVTGKS